MISRTPYIESLRRSALWSEARPLWLWDPAHLRIVWANQACLEFSKASCLDDLVRLKFSPDAVFVHQLAALSLDRNSQKAVRELLRFPASDGDFVLECLCRPREIGSGRDGILVELVADRGLVPSVAEKTGANGYDRASVNGAAQKSDSTQERQAREPNTLPESGSVIVGEIDDKEPAEPEIEQQNGFVYEPEDVDEDDLLILQEIARMINGPSGAAATGVSGRNNETQDQRPLVARRQLENRSAAPGKAGDGKVKSSQGAGKAAVKKAESAPLSKNGRSVERERTDKAEQTTPVTNRPGKAGTRNYFLESLPVALAIAMGGRLMRANEAFLYAFGYGSESELRKAGGLAALFPQSRGGVLEPDPSSALASARRPAIVRSARLTTIGVTSSGRQRQVGVAFRNVSTGRDPVQILVLHEDFPGLDGSQGQAPDDRRPNGLADPLRKSSEQAGRDSIEFLASVSHEVRTPLNSIIGFSELMKDERFGAVEPDKFRGYAKDIHASARHALSLINDLLDITKIMAGKPELDPEDMDLSSVIRDALGSMRIQARQGRINLRASLVDDLPRLFADRRSIRQILLNLLSNAIKFTPPGGTVEVSTRLDERGGIVLSVSDDGIGMHRGQIGTALEPFSQLERATGGKNDKLPAVDEGTGLGLPLTRALAMAHQAEFDIDSAPGEGTRVEIRFPPRNQENAAG